MELPHVDKQKRKELFNVDDEFTAIDEHELDYKDLKAFLYADTDAALQKLTRKYFPLFSPPYRTPDVPSGVIEGIGDYSNLKTLLTTGMMLRTLLELPELNDDDIKKRGIATTKEKGCTDLSLTIRLKSEDATKRFLATGISHAKKRHHRCTLLKDPKSSEQDPTFLLRIKTLHYGNLYFVCGALLDALSAIMLHDVTTTTKMGIPLQSSMSLASSFWYTMVDYFRKGRAGRCQVCSKPFIAFDERKNKRKYCGGACNKMHQRLMKFKGLVEEGCSEEDAAKEAEIKLDRAIDFWRHHISSSEDGF